MNMSVAPQTATSVLALMITGAQGIGKSGAALGLNGQPGLLHHGHGYVTVFFSPDNAKSAEAYADYEANRPKDAPSPEPYLVLGRRACDPKSGERMCRIHELAEAAARQGVNVRKVLCSRCPFAESCRYLKQEGALEKAGESEKGVVIFAPHDYAYIALPGHLRPARAIIDERPRDLGCHSHVVPVSVWDDFRSPFRRSDRSHGAIADALAEYDSLVAPLLEAIRDAVMKHPARGLERIREAALQLAAPVDGASAPFTIYEGKEPAELVRRAARLLRQWRDRSLERQMELTLSRQGQDSPDAAAFRQRLKGLLQAPMPSYGRAMIGIFEAIAKELEQRHGPALRAVHRLNLNGEESIVAEAVKPLALPAGIPLLHLDGTGELDLARALFGADMVRSHHPVERLGTALFVSGHSFSTASLTGSGWAQGCPSRPERAEALREHWKRVFSQHPKSFIALPKKAVEAFGPLLGHEVSWFGALRGRNMAEQCDTAIVIGRQQPRARDIERIARAVAVALNRPFNPLPEPQDGSCEDYPVRRVGLRMRDGTVHAIKVAHHPDPTADMVLRQVRDAETTQAADRVRAHFRPKRLILAGASVPDVTFDRIVPWHEFKQGGTRIERTLESQVLPLAPVELVRAFPEIWPNRRAVERDDAMRAVQEAVEVGRGIHEHLPSEDGLPLQLVSYTRPPSGTGRGQRARTFKALVLATPGEAPALIEKCLGSVIRIEVQPLPSSSCG
ncbi:MAG: hypothetical protein ACU0BO_11080 [Limimaricola soesokkakensis]|uniref:hypothetical protein n=1 Tax=Limimaricola soesokkakensis TaxID=1343159 RepID=UPI0040585AD6